MNIAVIRGGRTREYDSHLSAVEILADLRLGEDKVTDITIDENGDWYEKGVKTTPHHTLPHVDIIINTTRESDHVPLVRKMDIKKLFEVEPKVDNVRRLLFQLGIQYPNYTILSKQIKESDMHDLWRSVHVPLVIKSQNKKLPTMFTYNPDESLEYIREIQKRGDTPVIDTHITGRTYHAVAVSNLRGEKVYVPSMMESFKKYGKSIFARAQSLAEDEKLELRNMVDKVHMHLDVPMAVYDFIKTKNGFVLVHVSTRPRYIPGSLLHEAFLASGVTWREIAQAFKK
jgi:hypothetical protein